MNLEIKPNLEKFNIKKLNAADASKYRELRLKALQTDPGSFSAVYEEQLQKDDQYWEKKMSKLDRSYYAAEEGNRFISTAGLIKLDDGNLMITAVYTLPEFRNQNISSEILNTIIMEAKAKGAQKIKLNVNADNKPALKLYEKLGFKIIKTNQDKLKGDNTIHDSHLMEKNLAQ